MPQQRVQKSPPLVAVPGTTLKFHSRKDGNRGECIVSKEPIDSRSVALPNGDDRARVEQQSLSKPRAIRELDPLGGVVRRVARNRPDGAKVRVKCVHATPDLFGQDRWQDWPNDNIGTGNDNVEFGTIAKSWHGRQHNRKSVVDTKCFSAGDRVHYRLLAQSYAPPRDQTTPLKPPPCICRSAG